MAKQNSNVVSEREAVMEAMKRAIAEMKKAVKAMESVKGTK